MSVQCYSVRLLSPYRGMLQVIELNDTRALSHDGKQWKIQLCQQIREPGRTDTKKDRVYDRYMEAGLWSSSQGFSQAPLHPLRSVQLGDDKVQPLLNVLAQHHTQIPFPQKDQVELWLLDSDTDRPLALLQSRVDQQDLENHLSNLEWLPSPRGDASFESVNLNRQLALQAKKNPRKNPHVPIHHRNILAQRVHHRSGRPLPVQWFQRKADGSGIGLLGKHIDEALQGRTVPAKRFPELLLEGLWSNADDQQLVLEFYRWQAPLLLMLPTLSADAREWLEDAAFQQHATQVAQYYQLYPHIQNQALLNKALIEAAMHETRQTA